MRNRIFFGLWPFIVSLFFSLHIHGENQRWWGLSGDESSMTAMGTETAEVYTCAMECNPSNQKILSGATLHAIKFFLRDKESVSAVKVWVSASLPNSAEDADIIVVDVANDALVDYEHDRAMTEVTLPEAYQFDGRRVYVGFQFVVSNPLSADAQKKPVLSSGKGTGAAGAFWMRTSKTLLSWNDLHRSYGSLFIQLQLSNSQLSSYAVKPLSLSPVTALIGEMTTTDATLQSDGFLAVESVAIEVIGQSGHDLWSGTLPITINAPGEKTTVSLPLKMPEQSGISSYTVRVTEVNGKPNTTPHLSDPVQIVGAHQLGHRHSVVEEYTGTWCTNCPRGIVGMNNLHEIYGDDFIGIAIHVNNGNQKDPMHVSDYNSLLPPSVPRCQMDRVFWCDPYMGTKQDYHFHADEAFASVLSIPTEADLQLTALWSGDKDGELNIEAMTTFYVDNDQAPYALAFALTEDGMKGTTREWAQVNGESGRNTYPDADMDDIRNAPDPITEITYNHVLVAAQGANMGIEGSIQTPLLANQTQVYTTAFSLQANKVIQDKNHLNAIVMLINKETGRIVNATSIPVPPYQTDGILLIDSSPFTFQHSKNAYLYNLKGQKIEKPQKGIFIKDGKKIIL